MLREKLDNFCGNKGRIINIVQGEYILFIKSKINENIKGFFTDGVTTCSAIYISFNNEKIIFFCHLDESFELTKTLEQKVLPSIKNEKIENIEIVYTNGTNGCKNKHINYDEVIDCAICLLKTKCKFINNINISKLVVNHSLSTSLLKLFKRDSNILNDLKKKTINKIRICINGENQELQKKIEENVENYKKTINEPKCFICYYDGIRLSDLLLKLGYILN